MTRDLDLYKTGQAAWGLTHQRFMGYGVSRKLESYRIPRAKIRNVHLFLQERDTLKALE